MNFIYWRRLGLLFVCALVITLALTTLLTPLAPAEWAHPIGAAVGVAVGLLVIATCFHKVLR